jgi:CRISPR-associated protein Csd1
VILQALADYYERKRAADPRAIPERGFEHREIPFVIVISEEGEFLNIEDTRDAEAGRKRGRTFLVPEAEKRTSAIRANLLWDKPDYALGFVADRKRAERVRKQHGAFRDRITEVFGPDPEDIGLRALLVFLEAGEPDAARTHPTWLDVESTTGAYVGFRLSGDTRLICERSEVVKGIRNAVGSDTPSAQCLVTGEEGPIAALHPAIKGVWGAQPSGANIVSFNLSAFRTHGREQGANAPVSAAAAFAYTTALNLLLHRDSPTNAHVSDTTVVFWAEEGNEIRDLAGALFRSDQEILDDPDRGVDRLKAVYAAPAQGVLPGGDGGERFYVLGLAPNAARLAIRFWRPTTVAGFAAAVLRHFHDVEVVRPPWAGRYPSVAALLRATAVLGKDGNIAPNLAGAVVDAILTEQPYPRHLLIAAVQRARAEQDVSPDRAAVIKGCLIRAARHSANDPEVSVALDEGNDNVGYRLGRLFATLERVQNRANPSIQSGIRERYYGAASATPTAIFPTLMKLKNHHLAKIENRGAVVNLEQLLGSILDGVENFPTVLSLPDQGRFALGYYHQRQSFFTKSSEAEEVPHA